MRFEFATATRILFGPGTRRELSSLATASGRRALVVNGRRPERAAPQLKDLKSAGLHCVTYAVDGEPTTDAVRDGVRYARAERCDLVIGIGGGSAIDAGKAIAALATNPGELLDYLEVIGHGKALSQAPVPFIAIPTT